MENQNNQIYVTSNLPEEKIYDTNQISRGNWEREQKLVQIEYEISVLNHNIQKMRSFENDREKFIQDICLNLVNNKKYYLEQ